eukprot:PhF_6_TR30868/c0_g1_i1/m.45426
MSARTPLPPPPQLHPKQILEWCQRIGVQCEGVDLHFNPTTKLRGIIATRSFQPKEPIITTPLTSCIAPEVGFVKRVQNAFEARRIPANNRAELEAYALVIHLVARSHPNLTLENEYWTNVIESEPTTVEHSLRSKFEAKPEYREAEEEIRNRIRALALYMGCPMDGLLYAHKQVVRRGLPIPPHYTMALVPGVDFANHSDTPSCEVVYSSKKDGGGEHGGGEEDGGSVVLRALDKGVQKGDLLTFSYKYDPEADWLFYLRFGFIP